LRPSSSFSTAILPGGTHVGREEINAEKKENGLREKEEIEYPKQRNNNVENNIILY
jgi:hypothetical protein